MSSTFHAPWRSVWLPRALTAVALVVGLPLFLRSPPWCDVTLYMVAARNILQGGVHYLEVFDTNMPGYAWAMTAVYAVFGFNAVAVRVLDLLIVLGVVLLIDRLAKWGGASLAARWWAIAGAALFYPFTQEMAHAQRDLWMALPGLAAVVLRVRRGIERGEGSAPAHPFRASFVEGLLYGAGVWIKPHIALMALAVWLLTARRLAGEHPRPCRAAGADLLGNLLGGLLMGAAGIAGLVATNAWKAFLDVFLLWNPSYMDLALYELPWRADLELHWFPPWSLGLIITVPLALLSVIDSSFWSSCAAAAEPARPGPLGRWLPSWLWDRQASADARFVRGVLGGLYLVWATQCFVVQRGFQYAHVPETLLMIGLWASHRWSWVPVVLLWLAVTSGLWLAADCSPSLQEKLTGLSEKTRERYLPRHAITNIDRLRLWPDCWRTDLTDAERYALWDRVSLHPVHNSVIGWEEIAECAEFLRSQGVKDRQVIAWHDSPHAAYLLLDVKPGFRYMHVYTAMSIAAADKTGRIGFYRVMNDLNETKDAVYVITDLQWCVMAARDDPRKPELLGPPRNPPRELLPAYCPHTQHFPFDQPTVFRSRNGTGRYIVHHIPR